MGLLNKVKFIYHEFLKAAKTDEIGFRRIPDMIWCALR